MKLLQILLAILLLIIGSYSQIKERKTEVYILNTTADFGMNVHPEQFWIMPEDTDTLELKGEYLQSLIDKHLSALKDTINAPVETFIALVRTRDNVKDTFYSEPSFRYWHKGSKSYVDTSGFFFKAFSRYLNWYE